MMQEKGIMWGKANGLPYVLAAGVIQKEAKNKEFGISTCRKSTYCVSLWCSLID